MQNCPTNQKVGSSNFSGRAILPKTFSGRGPRSKNDFEKIQGPPGVLYPSGELRNSAGARKMRPVMPLPRFSCACDRLGTARPNGAATGKRELVDNCQSGGLKSSSRERRYRSRGCLPAQTKWMFSRAPFTFRHLGCNTASGIVNGELVVQYSQSEGDQCGDRRASC